MVRFLLCKANSEGEPMSSDRPILGMQNGTALFLKRLNPMIFIWEHSIMHLASVFSADTTILLEVPIQVSHPIPCPIFLFLSDHAAILACLKKLTKKLVISGKHSKTLFWHRLVPQSLQSTSLKDTFLIMLSSLHIHPKHTHTHTHTHILSPCYSHVTHHQGQAPLVLSQ